MMNNTDIIIKHTTPDLSLTNISKILLIKKHNENNKYKTFSSVQCPHWEDNIIKYLQALGRAGMDGTDLAQDRDTGGRLL